jgi:L,D-transpeptidase-like protein
MDNINKQRKGRQNKARERQNKRRQRHDTVSHLTEEGLSKLPDIPAPNWLEKIQPVLDILQDTWWHLRNRASLGKPLMIGGGLIGIIILLFALSIIFSSNIGPNISVFGLDLSGQSVEEATETLFIFWNNELKIDLMLNGERMAQVRPSDIGLQFDASMTAEAAKSAGLAGFPFGQEIEPIISSNYGEIQNYMLGLAQDVFIPSYEAGYEWRDGALVSVQGRSSRELDVALSIQRIVDSPLEVTQNRRIELVADSTAPRVVEADPFYQQAYTFVTGNFVVEGYDPFVDTREYWGTTKEEMANWLVVADNGLAIREDGLNGFVGTLNNILNDPENPRYLDPVEVYDSVNTAFREGTDMAEVRIRYQEATYTLEDGDWGYRLSRRTGLPFFNIQLANPSVDWNNTVAGQRINMPSRDLVMPLVPIANKRIVVDLDRMWLVAYEDGEPVFDWAISVGRTDAPTAPGVFQILEKIDVAYGSGFALCNDNGECGQWEMNYFMTIYEVGVGLTNGFHGAVLLPNGAYLNGGSQQLKSTFGCVMSDDAEAKILYDWSEPGVVVEAISREFSPMSETGREAIDFITQVSGQA